MRQVKILFAAVDIGWRIEHYSAFLKVNFGKKVISQSFVKYAVNKKQYRTKYTYNIQFSDLHPISQYFASISFFLFALIKYNTFYFLSGETILTRKLRHIEFKIYKLLNKKVIMHFVGSDIRDPNYVIWKEKNIVGYLNGKKTHQITQSWQDKLIADSLFYANEILVSTPDLLKIIPSAKYYPVVIDFIKFQKDINSSVIPTNSFFKTKKIRILHSPSLDKIKGSSLIKESIKELSKDSDKFEFIYTPDLKINTNSNYAVTRYQLFKLYMEADIVIDQMTIGWYGLQSIEAILGGCHVFCYIENNLRDQLFPKCPIHATDAINLKTDLLKLITNYYEPKYSEDLSWVKRHHSIEENNEILINSIMN